MTGQKEMDFFTEGSAIMDYGLIFCSWGDSLEHFIEIPWCIYDKHTAFGSTIQYVNWWTGVVWIIVIFLSAVWTLILTAPIHCRASIGEQVMQCLISQNLMKHTHLHLGWPWGWAIFFILAHLNFWVNYSFKLWHKIWTPLVSQTWNKWWGLLRIGVYCYFLQVVVFTRLFQCFRSSV